MKQINEKIDINYNSKLKDFEEIYQMAIDDGQLNIALKAKEMLLKYSEQCAEKPGGIADFVRILSPDELDELADAVHQKLREMKSDAEENSHPTTEQHAQNNQQTQET